MGRPLAVLISMALVAAACTGGTEEVATTEAPAETTAPDSAAAQALSINDVLGTQAVQDFVIYHAMWKLDDDDLVDFYDDVLDRAAEGAGAEVELAAGFGFAPVDTLTGEVVDPEGEPIPSLSVDYGLLRVGDGAYQATRAAILEVVAEADAPELIAALEDASPEPLLVEIITADLATSRTHAGPGDRSQLDLTWLDAVAPGDDIAVTYLFGQTLPGNPAEEAGLSPSELFAYRWNRGLIQVLGDPATRAPEPFTDAAVELVEGSTLMSREVKEALLFEDFLVRREQYLDDSRSVWPDLLASVERSNVDGFGRPGGRELFFLAPEGKVLRVSGDTRLRMEGCWEGFGGPSPFFEYSPKGDCPSLDVLPGLPGVTLVPFDTLPPIWATEDALSKCGEWAAALNSHNRVNVPVSDLLATGRDRAAQFRDDPTPPSSTVPEDLSSALDPLPPTVSCGPPPEAPAKPKTGSAYGDVHIATIDGKHYPNQAAGEFLLFDNGVAEVQIRLEPWPGDPDGNVSVTSAMAARMGDHVISMHLGGGTWIDGERAVLPRGEETSLGPGRVLWWGAGWTIHWPDGTMAHFDGQVALVTPPEGESVGLLGDNDGDPADDLVTRSGEQLDPNLVIDNIERFYDVFIDSWRITQEESLFHYEEGESTATFTIEGFPSEYVTTADLSEDVRSDAEELCRATGITRPEILDACILDVGVTGDPDFAYQAFLVEASTPAPEPPPAVADGGGVAGDNVLLIGGVAFGFGPNPPIQAPDAPAPRWQCEASDGLFTAIGSFSLSADTLYEVTAQYQEAGGEDRLTLVVNRSYEPYAWVNPAEHFQGAVEQVTLDGRTLTAAGRLYVNDPPTLGLGPINLLPEGSELTPFSLSFTCDG